MYRPGNRRALFVLYSVRYGIFPLLQLYRLYSQQGLYKFLCFLCESLPVIFFPLIQAVEHRVQEPRAWVKTLSSKQGIVFKVLQPFLELWRVCLFSFAEILEEIECRDGLSFQRKGKTDYSW